jgi:outer membrane protein TolC
MKYKLFIILIILLFIPQSAYSKSNLEKLELYPDEALTLKASIDLALANNPQIDIAEAQLEFAEARLRQIITDFLPTISASHSRNLDLEEGEVNEETSIDLSQSVFIDKGIIYAKHQAENDVEIARISLQQTKDDLVLQVKKAYYNVLLAEELVKLGYQKITRYKAHYKTVQHLQEQQMIAKVEALKTKADLDKAKAELVKYKNQLDTAQSKFNIVLNRNIYADVQLVPELEFNSLALSYTECMDFAKEHRPDWLQQRIAVRNSQLEIKIKQADKWPDISVGGTYGGDLLGDGDANTALTFNIDWEFWDWGRKERIVDQAKFAKKQIEFSETLLLKQIELDVKTKLYDVVLAENQIDAHEEILETAKEDLKNQLVRFKHQQATNTDVLDAQVLLSKSELELTEAIHDLSLARAELENALGVSDINCIELRGVPISDEKLLDFIERKSFYYFLEQQDLKTGLFRDASGGGDASVGTTGFGLTALCIGAERGWIDSKEAQRRALLCINSFLPDKKKSIRKDIIAQAKDGFFYHFLNIKTAERAGYCEVSTIDTALLIMGALTAGEYFKGDVKERALDLYKQVQWDKFLDKDTGYFYMSWTPEKGFSSYKWDYFTDEIIIISLLSIASPAYPVEPGIYYNWKREWTNEKDYNYIMSYNGALFCHQYANAWYDFRDLVDKNGINWYQNSKLAVLANRDFCIENSGKYKTYGPNSWGISSFYRPDGYTMHFGVMPNGSDIALHDGTISLPTAAASIVFTPYISLDTIWNYYNNYPDLWGVYGLKNSFNLDEGWHSPMYYGIDRGVMLLMLENFRSGFVWKQFMNTPYAKKGLDLAGFEKIIDDKIDKSDIIK